jgi:hypothetical protein
MKLFPVILFIFVIFVVITTIGYLGMFEGDYRNGYIYGYKDGELDRESGYVRIPNHVGKSQEYKDGWDDGYHDGRMGLAPEHNLYIDDRGAFRFTFIIGLSGCLFLIIMFIFSYWASKVLEQMETKEQPQSPPPMAIPVPETKKQKRLVKKTQQTNKSKEG